MTTLRLNRNQLVSSTEMARKFSEYLDRAGKKSERLFVTRNNQIEAVVLNIEDFEWLSELEELAEHLELADLITSRQNEPEVTDLEALLREEGLDIDELQEIDPE